MTHIVTPEKYPTKKSFREAIMNNPDKVYLSDPSILSPNSGYATEIVDENNSITVTNHPKRSWFANLKIATRGKNKGNIIVQ